MEIKFTNLLTTLIAIENREIQKASNPRIQTKEAYHKGRREAFEQLLMIVEQAEEQRCLVEGVTKKKPPVSEKRAAITKSIKHLAL